MADGARNDVLGQKAQAAQRAYEARGMSMPKALRRALSRTADVLWDLALVTQSASVEMLDQDQVVDALGVGNLLVLLDGPDGALGVASIDRQVMTAVVEVQTIQQVTQMPIDESRVLTQTDAAMMAPLLDGTLERLAQILLEHPLHGQLAGYRYGAMLEDPRIAGLLLDAAAYRAFRAEVDLALGRRKGRITFFLPERKPKPTETRQEDAVGPYEAQLSRVPTRLDASLSRVCLPLHRAEALRAGDLLPLPCDALDKIEIHAGRGHLVARGRLGQLNGLRAVRLTWPRLGPAAVTPGAGSGWPDGDTTAPGVAPPSPDADFDAPSQHGALPDLPALPAAEPAETFDLDLPALPPMDFGGDGMDMDLSDAAPGPDDPGEGRQMEALPEIDLDEGFASAPLDFDFDEK